MTTRTPIEIDSWQHCYNRGVDKRNVFRTARDYERFLLLMYLANSEHPVQISHGRLWSLSEYIDDNKLDRGKQIVEIGAYALMPNHVHMLLQEITEGGISLFMQRVFTGYTMYFNRKYERSGSLFAGTFKSKHVDDDVYLKKAVSYISLNPAELFDPSWKEISGSKKQLEKQLLAYPYSSLPDFLSPDENKKHILGNSIRSYFDLLPKIGEMIKDALEY